MQRRCSMGQGGAIIHHIVKAVTKGHVVDKWSQILFQTRMNKTLNKPSLEDQKGNEEGRGNEQRGRAQQ